MKIFDKIRKNTWLIFILIGIFLLLFLIDPNLLGKLFYHDVNIIGKVNKENIYEDEYINCLNFLKKIEENELNSDLFIENKVWDLLIREKILYQKALKSGIQYTKEEFWDFIKKKSVYNNFINFQNQKGEMDLRKFKRYIRNIENPPISKNYSQLEEERKMWNYEKENTKKKIISQKYIEMLMYGLNTSKKEAELSINEKNSFSIIDYVFIPYEEIKKKYNILISSNEIKNFIDRNKFLFKKENLRYLSFVILYPYPSLNDKKNIEIEMKELFFKLKNSKNISGLVNKNSEYPIDHNFYLKDYIPFKLKNFINEKNKIGSILGPIKNKDKYYLSKITGKKKIYDLISISHILISHRDAIRSVNSRNKNSAKKIIQNYYEIIKKNPKKFNSLLKKSDDFINNKKGMLGWIKYSEINNNIIGFDIFSSNNKKGDMGVIETEFGYHLIRINDMKNIKTAYQLSTIVKTLYPSKNTKKYFFKKANKFLIEHKKSNVNEFINNARKNKMKVLMLEEINDNQLHIDNLNNYLDKYIIKWAFDRRRNNGDIKLFNTLNNDCYIIAYLSKIQKKGIPINKIKNSLIPKLIDEKINNILQKKLSKKNIEYIASFFSKKIHRCKINFYDSIIEFHKEPKVTGIAFSLSENKTSNPIMGTKGVYFIKPKKKYSNFIKDSSIISYEIELSNIFLRNKLMKKIGDMLVENSKIEYYKRYNSN